MSNQSNQSNSVPTPIPVNAITPEEFRNALPDRLKRSVSPAMMQTINDRLAHPEMFETFRDNLLGYAHVLKEGRFKMTNYLDAVKYVSYKLGGHTNALSFSLVFPQKIKDWEARGMAPKEMSSYISGYNKSKLVNLIYEQSLIPMHVLNRDVFQKAINQQAYLMMNAKSEKVQSDAANSLMTHLKPPESAKIELEITDSKDSAIDALRESTTALVAQQKKMLEAGMVNAGEIAKTGIKIINPNQQPNQQP